MKAADGTGAPVAMRIARTLPAALAAAAFVTLVAGPAVLGYRVLTVLSGSMAPRIPTGAMIVSQPIDPATLRVGNVITYVSPGAEQIVLTHRVVEILEAGDEPLVRTRGDANSADDPWTARLRGGTVWRTTHVVPYVGSAMTALHRLNPRILLLWWLCAGAGSWTLRRIWRAPAGFAPGVPVSALVPPWPFVAAPSTTLVPAWPTSFSEPPHPGYSWLSGCAHHKARLPHTVRT